VYGNGVYSTSSGNSFVNIMNLRFHKNTEVLDHLSNYLLFKECLHNRTNLLRNKHKKYSIKYSNKSCYRAMYFKYSSQLCTSLSKPGRLVAAAMQCRAVCSPRFAGRHSAYRKWRIVPRTSSDSPERGGGWWLQSNSGALKRRMQVCTGNWNQQEL
jgi:hypothetical protein